MLKPEFIRYLFVFLWVKFKFKHHFSAICIKIVEFYYVVPNERSFKQRFQNVKHDFFIQME